MAIGTSLGAYYEDETAFHLAPYQKASDTGDADIEDRRGQKHGSDIGGMVTGILNNTFGYYPPLKEPPESEMGNALGMQDIKVPDRSFGEHLMDKAKNVYNSVVDEAIMTGKAIGQIKDALGKSEEDWDKFEKEMKEQERAKEDFSDWFPENRNPMIHPISATGNLTNSPDEILEGVESGSTQFPKGAGAPLGKQWAKEKAENAKIRATRDQPVPDFEHDNTAEIDRLIAKEQAGTAIKPEIEKLKNMLWDRYSPKKAGNRYD